MTMMPSNTINAQNVQPFLDAKVEVTSRQTVSDQPGQKINPVAGAVGVSISAGLRTQLAEASRTVRSVEEATDSLQAATSSLGEASRILLQLREVAVRATEEMPDDERQSLASQFDAGRKALEMIAETVTADRQATPGTMAEEEPLADHLSGTSGPEEENRGASHPFAFLAENGDALSRASVESTDGAQDALGQIDSVIEETQKDREHIDALQQQLELTLSSDLPVSAVDATRLGLQLL